jgi:hypothetical protein
MDRKRYLELCQINSVYENQAVVICQGVKYYPMELIIGFDKGKTKNSAYMKAIVGNSYTRANAEDVEEVTK